MTRRTPFLLGAAAALGLWGAACGGGTEASDAGSIDAPALADALVACSTDDECEDGLACNGEARCEEGRCVAGEPLRCDDTVACTMDFCSEELRRCVNRALDADLDGVAAASCVDARGMPLGSDCDDGDARVYPGASELCDAAGLDEDCDPSTRGGRDGDGDGFEDIACCNGSSCGDDCNDALRGASPSATEVCNAIDDDCDGNIDEGVLTTVYRDEDGDGRGVTAMSSMACASTPGFAAEGGDCDDTSASRSPALPEICDGIDNDCDGTPDPADTPVVSTWYADGDGDGFGDLARSLEACTPPAGYSLLATDCDDTDAARHPAQAELCNGIDDDCNGVADFSIGPGDGEDDDRDGRVDAACTPRPSDPDCDDRDASTGGDSSEVCDGRDNDCDGRTDEGVTSTSFYRDEDGDGWGSAGGGVIVGCGAVDGHSARSGDCDDRSSLRYPDALEGCNGVDDDCDGRVDEDPSASLCTSGQTCVAARCRPVPECPPGLRDCDGLASNGCETDVTMDTANCGVCGRRCAAEAGARGACVASRCSPLACDPGYLDCNGDLGRAGNGCERPASCGACGTGGAAETCRNGIDDNCDGRIDEGCCLAGVACTTTCGPAGVMVCNADGTTSCAPPSEVCNGVDDDCDGLLDEGCECTDGRMRSCGSSVGACRPGNQTCATGTWGACVGGVPAGAETCNAVDDDCDGTVDEGCACVDGATRPCGTDVGVCVAGSQTCAAGGWGSCDGATMGSTELCNGLDDDCDGMADEDFALGGACDGTDLDLCPEGIVVCNPATGATRCSDLTGTTVDLCNGMDDDCDASSVDGGEDPMLGTSCDGADSDLCAEGARVCAAGTLGCSDATGSTVDLCNGMDDDCDASSADGSEDPLVGASCDGADSDLCAEGTRACAGGLMCTDASGDSVEVCNGLDDDCNTFIDNTCPSGLGTGMAVDGPLFGASSGFDLQCPPGAVLIGLAGRAGGFVDQVDPRCSTISLLENTAMTPYTYSAAFGVPFSVGTGGGTGGEAFLDLCPAGQVVTGIRGGVGDFLDGLYLQCSDVVVALDLGGAWRVMTLLGGTTPLRGGSGGGPFTFDCAPGSAVSGLRGGEPGSLNSIGARCSPMTVGTR